MRLSLGKIKGGGSTCFEVKLHILLAQGINNCRPFMRLSWKNFYLIYKYWKYYRTLLSTNWFFFICESFLAKTWMFQSRVCYQRNIIWYMQYIFRCSISFSKKILKNKCFEKSFSLIQLFCLCSQRNHKSYASKIAVLGFWLEVQNNYLQNIFEWYNGMKLYDTIHEYSFSIKTTIKNVARIETKI